MTIDGMDGRQSGENQNLLFGVRKFFHKKKPFNAELFQGIAMGAVVALTMNEVGVYLLLQKSSVIGHIPSYVFGMRFPDLVISGICLLEFLLAPFISWWGYTRRSVTVALWLFAAAFATLPLMFLTYPAMESKGLDLCLARIMPPMEHPAKSTGRIVMMVIMGLVSALARCSVLSHGTAVVDEYTPDKVATFLAKALAFRIVMLSTAKYMIYDMMESNMWLQVLFLGLPLALKALITVFAMRNYNVLDWGEEMKGRDVRGFLTSFNRVIRNTTAMCHTLSLIILITAIWGYFYQDSFIIQTKYNIAPSFEKFGGLALNLMFISIVFIALIVGYQYSSPIMEVFDKVLATKSAFSYTLLCGILLIPLTLISCDKDAIQGVSELNYTQPDCSLGCGCMSPQNEFVPVCVLDTMTTYFSPCHAGCTSTQNINNVTVLSNCRCSPTGRAVYGPCKHSACTGVYSLHRVLSVGLLAACVLAVMMHVMAILRSIDERDKSIAIGVLSSSMALAVFVIGLWAYNGISDHTCLSWGNGQCLYHSMTLIKILAIVSGTLIAVSSFINVILWVRARRIHAKEIVQQDEST